MCHDSMVHYDLPIQGTFPLSDQRDGVVQLFTSNYMQGCWKLTSWAAEHGTLMVAKRKSLQTSVIVVKTPRKCNQTTWQTTPGCTQFDAFLLVPIDAGLDYTCVWAVLSICEAGMTASVTSVRAASHSCTWITFSDGGSAISSWSQNRWEINLQK